MSRIGRMPVEIPAGVEVSIDEHNCVTVKGPKGTLTRQFAQEMTITQEDGKIVVDNLFVGKFYIIEKNPASGYQYSEEKVFFEIKENGEIVKANMTNEQIIEVPDTGLNDVVNVVSFVLIVGGIAFLIYAKAKGNHFKK